MKYFLISFSLLIFLIASSINAEPTPDGGPESGTDIQILEPSTPETMTEAIPNSEDESEKEKNVDKTTSIIDQIDLEVPPPDVKDSKVVSEEELLKPKSKKTDSKIKSDKITETDIFISEADKYKITSEYKSLKLNDVIEQGLRKNYDQGLRNRKEILTELVLDSEFKKFWFPEVKLVLSTEKTLVSTLTSSSRISGTNHSKTPTGSFGVSFGDYTLYNWGKDYAQYLNTKARYTREKESYDESKKILKLDLIYSFFELAAKKNIEKIYQDKLRQTSFVYRLNKERLTVGKTSQQDYYLSRSDYLESQSDFHEMKMSTESTDENMAFLIADNVGTRYILTEQLDFKHLKITLTESLAQAQTYNGTLKNIKTELENAERSYDIAQKENLPLPKLSMNLGAYKKFFGPNTNRTVYEVENGNGKVELVAAINASWDLFGDDGFLNKTKLKNAKVNREMANYNLDKNKHYIDSQIRDYYKKAISYQNQMLILNARLPSVQKSYDIVLDNYLANKSRYNDYHLALNALTETKTLLEETKLGHLKAKLELAKLMGLDDFPGENFEQLSVKVKGK